MRNAQLRSRPAMKGGPSALTSMYNAVRAPVHDAKTNANGLARAGEQRRRKRRNNYVLVHFEGTCIGRRHRGGAHGSVDDAGGGATTGIAAHFLLGPHS